MSAFGGREQKLTIWDSGLYDEVKLNVVNTYCFVNKDVFVLPKLFRGWSCP